MSDNSENEVKVPPKGSLTADFYHWYEKQQAKQFEADEDARARECLRFLPDFEAAFILARELNDGRLDQAKSHDETKVEVEKPLKLKERMIRQLFCHRRGEELYLGISEYLGEQEIFTGYILNLSTGNLRIRRERANSHGKNLSKVVEFTENEVLKATKMMRERRDSIET